MIGNAEDRWVLASSAGFGFVTTLGDLFSRNRRGKSVLKVPKGADVLIPMAVADDGEQRIAAVSDAGRLLCFPLAELPQLARGKGNKIIGIPAKAFAAGSERMIAVAVLAVDARLRVVSGERVMTIKPRDLERYGGARGRRGALLPRGWRKVERLEPE
jgi:topoisomerase-4 subunit A